MKTHSEEVAARRYAESQSVAWLLEITDGEDAWRVASCAITFEGNAYADAMAEPPKWEMRAREEFAAGGIVGTSASVRIADVLGGESSFRPWIVARDPLGLAARLTLLWLDESASPESEDAVVMLDGVITGVELEAAAVRVAMRDRLGARLELPACRVLTRSMLGEEASPLLGEPLPLAFGAHVNASLRTLRSGALTRLADAISDTDDIIPLVSLDGFSGSGTVQIGNEMIAYTSIDLTAITLGTVGDPVTRGGAATAHSSGSRVRVVPDGGFQWIVADHECESVGVVRADGLVLDGADWTAELRDIGGIDAQVITMDAWPVVLGELANQIAADFEGWPAPTTGALENPADFLELLTTHARFAALDSALLDETSFDAAREDLDDHEYRFSRVVATRTTLGELIQSAARESAMWIRSGGAEITFARAGVSPHNADALETLDESRALEPNAALDLTPIEASQLHDRLELYSRVGSLGFARAIASLSDPAFAPLRRTLDWLAADAASAWPDLGARLWPRVSESHPRHEQSFPLGSARRYWSRAMLSRSRVCRSRWTARPRGSNASASMAVRARSSRRRDRKRAKFVGTWTTKRSCVTRDFVADSSRMSRVAP